MSRRALWLFGLGGISLAALAVRLTYLYMSARHAPFGHSDSFFHVEGANLLVEGHGFINPQAYLGHHQIIQDANFPPLWTLVLAIPSAFGWKSFFAHQVWSCLLGAVAVAAIGLTGRKLGGALVGLLAATIAAGYPNLWINDGLVRNETLSVLIVALVLLATYRFLSGPTWPNVEVLGVAVGLAALARDELALLVPLLVVPLVLLVGQRPFRRRLLHLGACVATAILVVMPWVGYNLSRFEHPELISTGLGVTLATANCKQTYSGPYLGYWYFECGSRLLRSEDDQSAQDLLDRHVALRFVGAHLGQLPVVVGARLGRAYGLYRPMQQITFDTFFEGRPRLPSLVGLYVYYALLAFSVLAAVMLRRRPRLLFPLLSVLAANLISVVITFGQARYRAPSEVVFVLLAAVGIGMSLSFSRRDRASMVTIPRGEEEPGVTALDVLSQAH